MMGLYYNKNSVTLNLDGTNFGIEPNNGKKNKKYSITNYNLQKYEEDLKSKDFKSIYLSLEFNDNGEKYKIIVVNSGKSDLKTILTYFRFRLKNDDNIFICSNLEENNNSKIFNNSKILYNKLIRSALIINNIQAQNGGFFKLNPLRFFSSKINEPVTIPVHLSNEIKQREREREAKIEEQREREAKIEAQTKIEAKLQTNSQTQSKKNVNEKILFSLSEHNRIIEEITKFYIKII